MKQEPWLANSALARAPHVSQFTFHATSVLAALIEDTPGFDNRFFEGAITKITNRWPGGWALLGVGAPPIGISCAGSLVTRP